MSFKAPDQVAFVKIWTEFIKKEQDLQMAREQGLKRTYRVDMKRLTVLPPKINNFDPRSVMEKKHDEPPKEPKDAAEAHWRSEIEKTRGGPRQSYYFTQTEAHEVGWVTTKKDLKKGRSKSRWRFGRTKSDVVAYADNYAMARGHNPYATSSSVVKKA